MRASAKVIFVLAALAATMLVAVGPATADYHTLCGTAGDSHILTNTGSQLRASGSITCTGRTINVQKFQILDVATQQPVASLAPMTCSGGCTFEIFAPLAAGYYEVSLQFHVSDNLITNFRQTEYLFLGSGQPSRTCGFRFGSVPVNCV
ncbi:MAG: hypothetical protein ACOYXM_10670 [Actinomycetota bacterium]